MQTSQILVAAITPLVSALIAGLVALTVARHQGRTARENWLFDKRYATYERAMETAMELMRGADDQQLPRRMRTAEVSSPFLEALVKLELVSPAPIRERSVELQQVAVGVGRRTHAIQDLVDGVDELLVMLRDDLVPKRLR